MPKPLERKVAIVTGASRGIGRAIALRLAHEGVTVVLAARSEPDLMKVASEIKSTGGKASVVNRDLRDPAAPGAVVNATLDLHGAIDIVVNNAGATKHGDFFELTEEDWTDGFALKFFCAVRITREAWPYLKERNGSVLNIIGIGGHTPGPEFTIGGSVNGACLAFTKAIADIGVRDGIQVNAINPGRIRTSRLEKMIQSEAVHHGGNMEVTLHEIVRKANIVRIGEPEDVARLAAFIVNPASRFLHGAVIDLDGGQTKTL